MPRQKLGQHWLDDHRVCEEIADMIALQPDETCIEIGGGKGALTKRLAGKPKRLIVFEIDHNWADHLRAYGPGWMEKAGGEGKSEIEVREADALNIIWNRGHLGLSPDEPVVVTGNLPYYITSPLFLRLAYGDLDFRRAIFLIQKEVARKICSKPGDSDYGRLTVSLGAFLKSEMLFDVPREAFKPPPEVMSSVIRMTPLAVPLIEKEWVRKFEKLVQVAFHMRRKTLRNNMKASFYDISDDRLDEILSSLGANSKTRAQEMDIQKFIMLTRLVENG